MTWILRNDFEWGWQIVCIHLQVHGQIVGSGRVNWGALTSSTSLTSVIWGDVRTRRAYPCNMSRKTSLLYTYSNVYRRIDCIIDIYLLRILRMRTKITKTRHDYPGYKDLRHVHVNDYGIITLNWMLYLSGFYTSWLMLMGSISGKGDLHMTPRSECEIGHFMNNFNFSDFLGTPNLHTQ